MGEVAIAPDARPDLFWRLSEDLLAITDVAGVLLRVNPAWSSTLGWDEDELLGRSSDWLRHPDDVEDPAHERANARSHVQAGGPPDRYEHRLRARDGSYRSVVWKAHPFDSLTYAVGRDVTAERARQQRFHDNEDFSRLALSAVDGVGVWTYDVATDLFTCDAAICELYDIDRATGAAGIAREAFLVNVHPDDRATLAAKMNAGLAAAGDLELEYRIVHPRGIRSLLSRGHTYFDGDGKPIRRTGIAIETTERRLVEEQLRQSQKMEAVGQLTGGLAHDFNNLLTGITGSLELMQVRMAQGRVDEVVRYVRAAQGAAKRAAALTHRLLAFSRRQTLEPRVTDIDRLVLGMEELIHRTIGPSITMAPFAATIGIWPTMVDPGQLESALLNLCINARDAMPDGGELAIETGHRWLDERAARDCDLDRGPFVMLCVRDNGTGMTPDVVARAFDPFFTTKPIGMGTGLGLSMVYGFARQSGGHLCITSEMGKGTSVCIYLPRHLGDVAEEEHIVEAPVADRIGTEKTVLIVDDEPTVRMLAVEILEELGFVAIEASDGMTGLEAIDSPVRIDLLITDVGLPGGMNGRQLADAARVKRPGLKVLFITGYAENAVLGHGHLDPGMHVLTKPFSIDGLASRIAQMVGAP